MKTATQKTFVIFSLLAFLMFGVSMNSFAASAAEHDALASEFENLAKEMQIKAEEISHKPSSSYFGKNAKRNKLHAVNKIRKYEKAAAEYAEQATYHQQLAAEQSELDSVAHQSQIDSSSNL